MIDFLIAASFTNCHQVGVATYYDRGDRTANGSRFNPHGYTAASDYFPMGSRVRVTNMRNHRSVVVKINDRGGQGVIDLTKAAFREIGSLHAGTVKVCTRQVG